jgi:hypothetical protein
MAQVKIVCDASYDDQLRLTGYAGGVYLSEQNRSTATMMYQGVAGELRNIQEGEMVAIYVGLLELYRRTALVDMRIDSIDIYTDSKSSEQTLLHLDDERYVDPSPHVHRLLQRIQNLCSQHGWKPNVFHVNAHVPSLNASGIERLNQVADQRAALVRKEALRQMIQPDYMSSPYVSVLLPKNTKSKEESELMKALGLHLVKQGKKLRLHIDGNNPHGHPFLSGMEAYCRVHKVPLTDIAELCAYDPQDVRNGMNMVMYRYYLQQQGKMSPFDLSGTPSEVRAAAASRLLYGDPTPELRHMDNPTGHPHEAASVVYDLMDPLSPSNPLRPHTVQGWVANYLDYVRIPVVIGLSAALKHAGLQLQHHLAPRQPASNTPSFSETPSASESRKEGLLHELQQIVEQYGSSLTPEQLSHKMIEVLTQHGHPKSTLFHDGMSRFIVISPKKDGEAFLRRVIRQAERLTPPQHQPMMPLPSTSRDDVDTSLSFRRK